MTEVNFFRRHNNNEGKQLKRYDSAFSIAISGSQTTEQRSIKRGLHQINSLKRTENKHLRYRSPFAALNIPVLTADAKNASH